MDWLMKTINVPRVTVDERDPPVAATVSGAATTGAAPFPLGQGRGPHRQKFNVNVRVMNRARRFGPDLGRRTLAPTGRSGAPGRIGEILEDEPLGEHGALNDKLIGAAA